MKEYRKSRINSSGKDVTRSQASHKDPLRQASAEALLIGLQHGITLNTLSWPKGRLTKAINDLVRSGHVQLKAVVGDIVIKLAKSGNGGGK
jgi:hypothetical protein